MTNYRFTQEMAEKWGVSERRINQYCAEGRILGAQRVGKAWAIPADAEKPADPRQTRRQGKPAPAKTASGALIDQANLMPLMNTPFAPGKCRKTVEAMAPGPRRDISPNTVRKYITQLEDKHLIETLPTTVWTLDGTARNGTLLYTVLPIHEAVNYHLGRQLTGLPPRKNGSKKR